MSDFDSGDELFDGVDADELTTLQQRPSVSKRKLESEVDKSTPPPKRQPTQFRDEAVVGDVETLDVFPDNVSNKPNHATMAARMRIAQDLLTQTFGYASFRHEQAGAIERLLAGENALTIFPTGAGKSLCYQVRHISFFKKKKKLPPQLGSDTQNRYRPLLLSRLTWRGDQEHLVNMGSASSSRPSLP